jgi:hypothetical protein
MDPPDQLSAMENDERMRRIQAAESAQRERWLEWILTAKSPDELFG